MSNLFDLLTYRSYAHNRLESPEVSPERWARIFPNAAAMEKRFVREFEAALMQSTTGILDVADHTISTAENQPFKDGTTVGSSGEATATASPLQVLGLNAPALEAFNTEEEVSTGSRKRSECAVHSSVGRPTDFLSFPVPLGREGAMPQTVPHVSRNEETRRFVDTRTPAAPQILPEPFTLQQTGAAASTSLDVVPENFSCFIERIDEFAAARLLKLADCFCGRPSVRECPCGEPICANHSYDSLCGTCTEAKQLQQSSVMPGADRYEGAR